MVITKTKPVGIDWYIQKAQTVLYNNLVAKWTGVNYKCYGRCYRNKTDNGYIAENFEGGNDYKEVYWDDSLDVVSFFGVGEKLINTLENSADVHLVFFVNLKTLKPSILHRADEEVRQDVVNVFGNARFGLNYQSMELWLENVLKEYPGSRRDDRLKAVDMHPTHCFRLNYKLFYDDSKIC